MVYRETSMIPLPDLFVQQCYPSCSRTRLIRIVFPARLCLMLSSLFLYMHHLTLPLPHTSAALIPSPCPSTPPSTYSYISPVYLPPTPGPPTAHPPACTYHSLVTTYVNLLQNAARVIGRFRITLYLLVFLSLLAVR
ncbi:hypothetical protein C8T65DRAFT_11911 [Cerioporus squamosus]|nr:hypothetical protein C8T65DRAFT_11911 [Cerioporus squamosus]